jgi:PKD repeat protein
MMHKMRSWSLFFLMGLVLLMLIFPQVVSAQSPIAQFTANTTRGTVPLTVQFTDKSESAGTTSYKWEFRNEGIITSTSTVKNPLITYTKVGNKTVKLTVTNTSGSDSEIKTNYIKVSSPSITVTSPNGMETWQRGTSHTITWDYTGNPGSTVKIVLMKAGVEVGTIKDNRSIGSNGKGSYSWAVALSGSGGTGSDYKVSVQSSPQPAIKDVSNNYFTITSGTSTPGNKTPPTARFAANTTQGNAPLTVQFSDQSVSAGTTSYQWDTNNDGIIDSTAQNPVSTYQAAGNYTVKLTVTNASGSDSEIKQNYIKVSSPVFDLPTDVTIGAESNPTGNPIGGGTGYSDIILPGNPNIKYTVTNYAEFASALTKTYKKGDIIYVPESASINMTGHPGVVIPGNVTIASNRGSNGSPGGRFFWLSSPSDSSHGYQTGTMFYITSDNVRITGLRLEGPHMTTDPSVGDNSKQRSAMDLRNGKGLEIDNCEMYGWAYAAVDIETSTGQDALYVLGLNSAEIGSAIANIHHNYIHHCQMDGLGYGVVLGRGTALVKANLFDYTRHAIAASGLQNEGYEASYNIHLGHGYVGSVFDMHGQDVGGVERIAGTLVKIHHNTLNYTIDYSVGIRGTPLNQEYIYNNKMLWFVSGGKNYPPVYQSCGSTTNVTMTNNMIGGVLYPGNVIRYFSQC